jgi:hypothetical protein
VQTEEESGARIQEPGGSGVRRGMGGEEYHRAAVKGER